jgi:hypothetical protein
MLRNAEMKAKTSKLESSFIISDVYLKTSLSIILLCNKWREKAVTSWLASQNDSYCARQHRLISSPALTHQMTFRMREDRVESTAHRFDLPLYLESR